MAYRLNLLWKLEPMPNICHMSLLKKYVLDPNHPIVNVPTEVTKNLSYEERHVQILDYRVKQLCNKDIIN